MTSDVQHNQNEIISKYIYLIWIYGLQVVRLKENVAALLETTVQQKATNPQTIDMLRAKGSSRSYCKC